ncbi:DUF418 domain-containing protein [Microbacterium sp. LWH12-1.2]|uniref:DUF418 domain-containing protein n=1 Tax=Microbacterium sp. LWH12-1.2 TaxID=3135259 RepID=UPI0034135A38
MTDLVSPSPLTPHRRHSPPALPAPPAPPTPPAESAAADATDHTGSTSSRPIESARSPRRIPSLDVIRGVAIIGTLASNIWLFVAFTGDRAVDIWWHDFLGWIPDGKFLGLLTIMFGIGLEIQRQAALRRGLRWPGTYPIRAGLLFLDGALNYIFVVQFDVLRAYAIVGFIVAFVLLLPEKRQWVFIGAALATHLTILTIGIFAPGGVSLPGIVLPGEFPVYEARPTYWQTVHENVLTVFSDITLGTDAGTIITLGLAVFTLGAVLYRNGIFESRGARLRKWLMVIGFGVGLPLDLLAFVTGDTFNFGRYVTAPMVAFGVLALMAEFYQRRSIGFVGRRLSMVGQMALTCYVLQNILGRVGQYVIGNSPLSGLIDPVLGTLAMFVVITLLLVLFAELWLRAFPRGPLEYVWHVCFELITRKLRRSS